MRKWTLGMLILAIAGCAQQPVAPSAAFTDSADSGHRDQTRSMVQGRRCLVRRGQGHLAGLPVTFAFVAASVKSLAGETA